MKRAAQPNVRLLSGETSPVLQNMKPINSRSLSITQAVEGDAEIISSLITALSDPFFTSPQREGAEPFLQSISAPAIQSYIANERYFYLVLRLNGELAGVAALRDKTHVFHLFVASSFQRRGLARVLWNSLLEKADGAKPLTVNSSLNAVPIYEAFGFLPDGNIVSVNGVSFQPMRRSLPAA